MGSMLRPALFIMNRLKFTQKFLLISSLFALPLGLTTYYFVHGINADIRLASNERKGLTYVHILSPLIEHLQILRGTAYDEGISKSFYIQHAQLASLQIATDIRAVDTINGSLGKSFDTETSWQNWKSSWIQFQDEAPNLTRQKYFDRCSDLIAGIGTLMTHIGEGSDLVLDSSIDSTNLIKISLDNLPLIADLFGQMYGQHRAQPQKEASFTEEQRLSLLTQAQGEWEEVEHGLKGAYKVNPALKAGMEPQVRILRKAFQDLSKLSVKKPTQATSSAALQQENSRLFSAYTVALHAVAAEHNLTTQTLNTLLTQRIQEFSAKRNQVLGLTFVTALLVLYFLTGFYVSIQRMVERLTTTTKQMLAGEKSEMVILENRDEMASVVSSFNQIILELQKTAAEIRDHNSNLEEMVEERTRKIEYQAYHDALTGLPNRPCFRNRLDATLQKARRSARPLAVLFLDLDNFKTINDSLGHEAGDQLLKGIAERLTACMRTGDTVARMGGDEFTMLLENIDSVEEAIEVTERILTSLRQPLNLGAREVFPSGSIGINFTREVDQDADGMLRDADTAMYHAKSNGKANYAVFDSTMSEKVVERMQLEASLQSALERNEFIIHYQPLINLETGFMSGAEALLRWNHSQLGIIQPGKFIPIAEETGLIVPIGYWVLEEACRQTKRWQEQYPAAPPFTINVNLSGRQLQRDDVVERVQEVLEKTGMEPALLKLEITESVMMKDIEGTVAKLHRLKALGVKLAMDDFGTGYSSMANLSLFPLDTVKIDRSFVQNLADQEQAVSIVAAIINLSHALHMDVTGEGIETPDHVSYLQSMGCQIGQGYYFDRPMPPTNMGEKINANDNTHIQSRDAADIELIEKLLRAA